MTMATFNELTKDQLEALYKEHATTGIAAMFGVGATTVTTRFIKLGIQRRAPGGRRVFDPPAEELRSLYQQMSMLKIAKKYGVSSTVVGERLKEHGIELHDFKDHRLKPKHRGFSNQHCENFAYLLGVFLGDGCVTLWSNRARASRGLSPSNRLQFRLNTIDEGFATATKTALQALTDYKVTVCCHAVAKSKNPNWSLTCGDQALCQRLVADTEKKQIIPEYVFAL
jgi:hypothetical protein